MVCLPRNVTSQNLDFSISKNSSLVCEAYDTQQKLDKLLFIQDVNYVIVLLYSIKHSEDVLAKCALHNNFIKILISFSFMIMRFQN